MIYYKQSNVFFKNFQVLRLMRGYDEYNTLLLPPRGVNDKLPHELLDFYDGNFLMWLLNSSLIFN